MAEQDRRPRKDQERNRQALLAAAHGVFAERGIDAPLDLVARRAGLGNATLYRHFPSRRVLVTAVLRSNLTRSAEQLSAALRAPTGWEGFVDYLSWHLAEQLVNAGYMGALRAVPSGQDGEIDRLRDSTVADLEALIVRAQDEGAMRTDRYLEDVFLVLSMNEAMAGSDYRDRDRITERFLDLVVAAFAAPGVAPEPDRGARSVRALRRTLGHQLAGLPLGQARD